MFKVSLEDTGIEKFGARKPIRKKDVVYVRDTKSFKI